MLAARQTRRGNATVIPHCVNLRPRSRLQARDSWSARAGTVCAPHAHMIRALAIAAVLAATAHTASAGVYGSLGVGNTGVDDSANTFTQDSRSVRVAGGYQFMEYLGAEAGFMGYDAVDKFGQYGSQELYAAGLFHWPIADGFEVFGRLGVEHTSLSRANAPNAATFAGNGYLYGAGFEYKIKIPNMPLPHLSVWVDYTRNNSSLFANSATTQFDDFGVSMWTLGVTVGL